MGKVLEMSCIYFRYGEFQVVNVKLFAENKLYLTSVCKCIQQLGSPLLDYGDSSIVTMPGSVHQCMHAAELVGSPGMFCLMDFAHLVEKERPKMERIFTNMSICFIIFMTEIYKKNIFGY